MGRAGVLESPEEEVQLWQLGLWGGAGELRENITRKTPPWEVAPRGGGAGLSPTTE